MTNRGVPPEIEDAARRRSTARAEGDWSTADQLREEIEAAGWRVIDSGTAFRLVPASPPTVEVGGEIRYGRSDAVPSRLDEPATGIATVVFVASPDATETRRSLDGLIDGAPPGIDVVVIADGVGDDVVDAVGRASAGRSVSIERIRTSAPLGAGVVLSIGIRRSRAPVMVVLDPSVVPAGDVVTPLVHALDDPVVAVAGPFGLATTDLRRFEEVVATTEPVAAATIQGSLMAFRRVDAVARGPIDEGFRVSRNLDIWWSFVLRDEGDDRQPRRASVVPGLALERRERAARGGKSPGELARLTRRNFYRVLDRFGARQDLAVSAESRSLSGGSGPV